MVAPQRISNPRSARTATQTRIVKTTRARYTAIVRVTSGVCVALVGLMSYVMLLSNAPASPTRSTKRTINATRCKSKPRGSTIASRKPAPKIGSRRSRPNCSMHDAQTFTVVAFESPLLVAKSRIPIFDTIAAWF